MRRSMDVNKAQEARNDTAVELHAHKRKYIYLVKK